MPKELPRNVIADTLNGKLRRIERMKHDEDHIPYIHVSSLIRSDPADFFCPREFVLRYMERAESAGGSIPPKFELLWATGHFLGDYIVQTFLRRNPDWAQYAWGDWTCPCKHTYRHRELYDPQVICEKCEMPAIIYQEVDLFNPAKTVIGHSDLLFNVDGYFYVYEFKSIERADVVFDEITEPLGDHLTQASNYYYMLKGEGKKVSRRIRFVYIDRSMRELYKGKPYREVSAMAIPQRRLANFYARSKTVHDSIKKGKLPQRVCEDISCGRAKNCSRAVSCFSRRKTSIKRIP